MLNLKFRARSYTGNWYYGASNPVGKLESNLATFFTNIYAGNFDVKTLGQFAGIYDSRKIAIYEDDLTEIISDKMSVIESSRRIVQVIYDRTTASFGLWGIRTDDHKQKVGFVSFYYLFGKTALPNITVIGNIHETPKRWQYGGTSC